MLERRRGSPTRARRAVRAGGTAHGLLCRWTEVNVARGSKPHGPTFVHVSAHRLKLLSNQPKAGASAPVAPSFARWRGTLHGMDRIADASWRDQQPPFDGLTLATGTLPSSELTAVAAELVAFLRDAFQGVSLHTAEDWLEYDGFVNEPEAAEWSDLEGAV